MLSKIMTALRGKANETGQAVVDSQALRILDQEIRDSETHLSQSKTELTRLMGQRQLNSNKADTLESKIAELEKSAEAALDKGEEALAVEVAERMVALQDDLEAERAIVSEYDASIEKLRGAIRSTDNQLRQLKQQVSVVKATESAQKAQSAVASRHSGQNSAMSSAMESLERIKERQQLNSAQMQAADDMAAEESGSSLEARLKAAGVGGQNRKADDVLARLKAKKNAAQE
ncbi:MULTISPECIES: PspA/IM30 family protein [unclassified Halomonas]|uniref:PspA/IM30 family protein n=1 Tax=unclassified Halomonas TaxID=2609666 RepID=UPI0007D91873|nr:MULTISPECIES: PspA/IM30 family protein [unclassified Halomonas]MBT2786122.1 PspA/IM30 family protein [Halomonas sp. ISL-106]MBT2797144.1 PspA/IM30 family protein [Halomonas sp. ISL-104]OAL58525.1 phage shock protein A [Halomonas sp. ALS9]